MTQTIPVHETPTVGPPQSADAAPSSPTSNVPVSKPARPIAERPPTWTYTDEPIFKLSVEAYHELVRLGQLTSDDKVELIEGVLVHRMSKNPPHEFCKNQLVVILSRLLPPGWFCRTEAPLTLGDGEPEPDVSVVRGNNRDFLQRHPHAADVGLVIEVSDTTHRRDRGSKRRAYARGGVGVYWIVDLTTRQVEVHTDPNPAAEPPTYAEPRHYGAGESIPVMLDGKRIGEVAVSDVLP
ncbi:MAG TPA: Uma2 family endonuclease [Tepidisphaeraceae bacterium]|jgi:Uma2 family endonuclease